MIKSPDYKNAEARALYFTVIKKFGSFAGMATYFNVSRQYFAECTKKELPIKYAGYLGRLCEFHPGILNYESYISIGGEKEYSALVHQNSFFSKVEKAYIVKGVYIKDSKAFLKRIDREFKK